MTDTFPKPGWLARLLCRYDHHHWKETGAKSVVIPTGNALLIKSRTRHWYCARNCGATRTEEYKRD